MTFCVAAATVHEGKNAIVACCDMQMTNGGEQVRPEESSKLAYFGRGTILKTGDVSHADELIALIQPVLDGYNCAPKPAEEFDARISALLADLRKAVRKRKADLVEHYLGLRHNVSLADFRKNGAAWFPPDEYGSILHEMRHLKLGCELICAYADDNEPVIVQITQDGEVVWQDHYASIGSGRDIGIAILAQSDWYAAPPLMDCLARVYLAKMTAESDPLVGRKTLIDVMIEGEDFDDLSPEGRDYLAEKVERIAIPDGLEFRPSFLMVTHSDTSRRAPQLPAYERNGST
jgi:20S proteasome alpha/beta subunit